MALLTFLPYGNASPQINTDNTDPRFEMVIAADSNYVPADTINVPLLVSEATLEVTAIDSSEASATIFIPFRKEIDSVAKLHNLPPALLAAFIQEESAYKTWAVRTEPHYKQKKVVLDGARAWSRNHGGIPTFYTELDNRSQSFGLMQVMGQTARENGYKERYLTTLCDPFNGIEQGARVLKQKLAKYGDTLSMISAYNQGNNRKSGGRFINARYVNRVIFAWEAYEFVFAEYRDSIKVRRPSKSTPAIRRGALDRAIDSEQGRSTPPYRFGHYDINDDSGIGAASRGLRIFGDPYAASIDTTRWSTRDTIRAAIAPASSGGAPTERRGVPPNWFLVGFGLFGTVVFGYAIHRARQHAGDGYDNAMHVPSERPTSSASRYRIRGSLNASGH